MTRLLMLVLSIPLVACARGPVAQPPSDGPSSSRPASSGTGYTVTPAVFAARPDGGTDEALMVVGGERPKVVAALRAAGRRWMYVTEDGADLSGLAPDTNALAEAAGDRYTPNFVFDVYLADRGPALMVDCKGVVPPPMARTFVRIVEEELLRAGVTAALVDAPGPYRGNEQILAPVP